MHTLALAGTEADALADADLLQQLSRETATELSAGIDAGLEEIPQALPPALRAAMLENVKVFSQAKSYQQLRLITDLLLDSSGNLRSWSSFSAEVKKVNSTYNLSYLKAEYNTANASAQMAAKWADFKETAADFDIIIEVVQDERTRAKHRERDGIVRPVGDPFWRTNYPPFDFNCRCTARKVRKGSYPYKDLPPAIEKGTDLKPMFRNNVGLTGVIFDKSSPYFDINPEDKARLNVL